MATADHVCETSGGAWSGASPTTTVPSVFMPRIAPPYTPNSITWRPSSVAPRAITWAASCTPWPPIPVIRSSRSTQPSQHERLQVLDVVIGAAAARDEGVVHAPYREVIDRVGVAFRIAAGVGDRVAQRAYEELARARHFLGEPIGEPGVVDRERPGVVGGGTVAGLLHDTGHPRPHPRRPGPDAGPAVLRVGEDLTLAIAQE